MEGLFGEGPTTFPIGTDAGGALAAPVLKAPLPPPGGPPSSSAPNGLLPPSGGASGLPPPQLSAVLPPTTAGLPPPTLGGLPPPNIGGLRPPVTTGGPTQAAGLPPPSVLPGVNAIGGISEGSVQAPGGASTNVTGLLAPKPPSNIVPPISR